MAAAIALSYPVPLARRGIRGSKEFPVLWGPLVRRGSKESKVSAAPPASLVPKDYRVLKGRKGRVDRLVRRVRKDLKGPRDFPEPPVLPALLVPLVQRVPLALLDLG